MTDMGLICKGTYLGWHEKLCGNVMVHVPAWSHEDFGGWEGRLQDPHPKPHLCTAHIPPTQSPQHLPLSSRFVCSPQTTIHIRLHQKPRAEVRRHIFLFFYISLRKDIFFLVFFNIFI